MESDDPDAGASAPQARDIGRALSWLGVGHLAGQLWWYGSLIALAALLSPRDFGTIAAGLVIVQIAQYLMEGGTRGSLIIAPRLSVGLLRRAFAFNLTSGVLLTLLIVGLAQPFIDTFASGGQSGPIRLLALSVVFAALVPVPMAVLQRNLDFRRQATVMGFAATFASVASIAAAVLGAGAWSLALRQVLFQLAIACLVWWSVRRMLPRSRASSERVSAARQKQAGWFFLVSLAQYLAFNIDYLVVGSVTDAKRLGLYSLAFILAFSPVSQFSSQIGKVVLPATAATSDLAVVARRALKATRLLALVIAPCVAPVIVLAPHILPAVFGPEWSSMVLPFQILLVAAMGQALLSVIQESLSGSGNVAFFAKVSMIWLAAMVVVLVVFVRVYGLSGAALAHLTMVLPLAVVYGTAGVRRLSLRTGDLLMGLRGVVGIVVIQAALIAATVAGLHAVGLQATVTDIVAALVGVAAVIALVGRLKDNPMRDARVLVNAARSPAD